jgi:uncharacterized protein
MPPNNGETNLEKLIANMEPILNTGEFVFVSVLDVSIIPRGIAICEFREQEGTTVVLPKAEALRLGLSFDFVAAWITLKIHSALAAVGLTAAFSAELAKQNISCNVIAGYYHDHIFVDTVDSQKAMLALQALVSSFKISE